MKMLELTKHRLLASFPSYSILRSPQRKLRYAVVHHCPVYFYNKDHLVRIIQNAGVNNFKVIKLSAGPG